MGSKPKRGSISLVMKRYSIAEQTDPKTKELTPSELFTKKEIARKLKISERTIETDPDFPSIRWGGRAVRYDWVDVLDYLKSKSVKG